MFNGWLNRTVAHSYEGRYTNKNDIAEEYLMTWENVQDIIGGMKVTQTNMKYRSNFVKTTRKPTPPPNPPIYQTVNQNYF